MFGGYFRELVLEALLVASGRQAMYPCYYLGDDRLVCALLEIVIRGHGRRLLPVLLG